MRAELPHVTQKPTYASGAVKAFPFTPRAGASVEITVADIRSEFQFMPLREASEVGEVGVEVIVVSIHAPYGGIGVMMGSRISALTVSIHAPAWGHHLLFNSTILPTLFQFMPPRGGHQSTGDDCDFLLMSHLPLTPRAREKTANS